MLEPQASSLELLEVLAGIHHSRKKAITSFSPCPCLCLLSRASQQGLKSRRCRCLYFISEHLFCMVTGLLGSRLATPLHLAHCFLCPVHSHGQAMPILPEVVA